MSEIRQVLLLLFELYLALGLMMIGFGFMVGGKNGGSRAARAYFGNSLRWIWSRVRSLFWAAVAYVSGALMFWVLRPLTHRLWRGVRWLVTRERGWLRR